MALRGVDAGTARPPLELGLIPACDDAKRRPSLAKAGADIVGPSDLRMPGWRRSETLWLAGGVSSPVMSSARSLLGVLRTLTRGPGLRPPQVRRRRSYRWMGANLRRKMREIDQDMAEGAEP